MRLILILFALVLWVAPAAAQPSAKPFSLPVALPPGPNTWLFGQPYGNTAGAFLRGDDWYRAGQRLHFGIDLSMPCGTPLIAIGDGEVVGVDDLSFGSAPHNLLIRHDAGYVSLYGHLLERPPLVPGQRVSSGQEVARSGDPDVTCDSRPHLHLEIRSLDYRTAYNPVALIDADWHTLALAGPFRYPLFQQDLDNARRWLTLEDQPDVAFGGQALNVYAASYPPIEAYSAPLAAPIGPLAAAPESAERGWRVRRLAFDGCCANAAWHPTRPDLLYLIDGAPGQRALVYEWDVTAGPTGLVMPAPPPLRSPDGTYTIIWGDPLVTIRREADGAQWMVDTGGGIPAISPNNASLMWLRAGDVTPSGQDSPDVALWVSGIDGINARPIAIAPGLNAAWLDGTRQLVWQRTGITTTLFTYDTILGETIRLGSFDWLRGLSIAPGGGRLLFYLAYQADANASGVYALATTGGEAAQRLPWFGGWRWRDADSVYYVPQDVTRVGHQLRVYDIPSGTDRSLTDPAVTPLVIANGDWSVSADGARIAFWNALDMTVWVIEQAGDTAAAPPA
jgi:murein DD-endopeptidase MepM/ murein hydrolase activator NlpD